MIFSKIVYLFCLFSFLKIVSKIFLKKRFQSFLQDRRRQMAGISTKKMSYYFLGFPKKIRFKFSDRVFYNDVGSEMFKNEKRKKEKQERKRESNIKNEEIFTKMSRTFWKILKDFKHCFSLFILGMTRRITEQNRTEDIPFHLLDSREYFLPNFFPRFLIPTKWFNLIRR